MLDFASLPNATEPADALAAVAHALGDGWTWAQIAEALGVSRQAAHKRLASLVS